MRGWRLWKAAAEKEGMPSGLPEHLGATLSWWGTNKWCDTYGPYAGMSYDGNDPEFCDLCLDNYEHVQEGEDRSNTKARPWYTSIRKHGENRAVYNQKDRRPEIYRVGVFDIEKMKADISSTNWPAGLQSVAKRSTAPGLGARMPKETAPYG